MGYKNTEDSKYKFINPYNFVSVNWNKTNRKTIEDHLQQDRISGFFDCELKTVTPLAIPYERTDENGHGVYSFLRNPKDNMPMIPGSSLRGCIRTVYETVSDSCLVTADVGGQFTKRASMGEAGKPGLLIREKNGWKLYEAERFLIIIDDKGYREFRRPEFSAAKRITRKELETYEYGQKVYFCRGNMYKKNNYEIGTVVKSFSRDKNVENKEEGYLYIGEVPLAKDIKTNKHFESIFKRKEGDTALNVEITKKDIEGLKTIARMYNDSGINRNKMEGAREWYKGVEEKLSRDEEGTVVPLWFKRDDYTLSLASIGRIVYKKTMDDFVDKKRPCKKRNSLCKACALFGMSKDESIGSRVRITDAKMQDPGYKGEEVTLKELGSPRTSYIPFYATINGNPYTFISSYDEKGVRLRGRKFYWHNTQERAYEAERSLPEKERKTERNATMELVEKNKIFKFKVYFDEISRTQYEELKWALTLGDNRIDSNLCYKIGHGKPIGLGSAKIVIVKESIRSLNPYEIKKNDEIQVGNPFGIDKDKDELLTILDVRSTEGKLVSYPFIVNKGEGKENDTASHKWFSDNWDIRPRKEKLEQGLLFPDKAKDKDNLLNAKIFISDVQANDRREILKSQNREKTEYNKGEIYEGEVIGYNNSGKFAQVRLSGGGRASFYDDKHEWDRCKVRVKYLGKKDNYDKWERV